jgi:hypothetical protein
MKTIYRFSLCLALVLFLSEFVTYGQEKTAPKIFHLETRDGNGYTGLVLSSDSFSVRFKAEKLGEITVLRTEVLSLEPLEDKQLKDGKYWFPNPQSTRYFFSPNGYGLKKGEGYYQNIWVLMNSVAIGLTDHVSVGAGMIPLFLFAGAPTPVWVTAKVSIPVVKDKFNLGAGLLAGTAVGEPDTGFGIFYGLATIGSKDRNVTLGGGYGFAVDSENGSPMFNLSGMLRIGPRGYLVTENYLFVSEFSSTLVLSFGGRTIIKGAGLDYGLIVPAISDAGMILIPWLGITIPIGRK